VADARHKIRSAARWTGALVLALVLSVTSCASRAPVPTATAAVPSSEDLAALIRLGCHRCLADAFEKAQARAARAHAFEAAALLVLRSKELGLPHEAWLEAARTLADVESRPVLTMIEALPQDALSGDPDAALNMAGRVQARTSLAAWRETLQTGPWSAVFRAYLDVSLVCAFGKLNTDEHSFAGPLDVVAEAPVYQYRIGVCDNSQWARLAEFRERYPEYVDADYALGRYAFEDPVNPNQEEGLQRLQSAAAAFPRSPAIATMTGNVYRAWEEWAPALEAYDRAIALSPNHPEALLGRTISLSRLGRPDDAIETASRIIDGGQWRRGEAYYWRGWNHLVRGDYQSARSDTDRAKGLMANAAVFVLSGAIEWRLLRRESAEKEFEQALVMDLGECEAAFNLGVVRDELGKAGQAVAAFTQSRQCYDLSIALRREAIAKLRSAPGNETTRNRAAALHERTLRDFEARREEADRLIRRLSLQQPLAR
jgi:tetratricopeptide (TPR) repeat protein